MRALPEAASRTTHSAMAAVRWPPKPTLVPLALILVLLLLLRLPSLLLMLVLALAPLVPVAVPLKIQ